MTPNGVGDLVEKISSEIIEDIIDRIDDYEFDSFLIGVRSDDENIKNELKRKLKRFLQKITGKRIDFNNPDMTIIVDLERNSVELHIRPLYIYGKYNKYKEMPQTKWLCRACRGVGCERCEWTGKMYGESVEERIGDVLIDLLDGKSTSFHGAGREDIDALCTGWREFVIEIHEPRIRSIDLKSAEKRINEKNKGIIEVKDLKFVDKNFVRALKEKRVSKIYDVFITADNPGPLNLDEVETDNEIIILQKTPKRVLHRRANRIRKRRVKILRIEKLYGNRLFMRIMAEHGTYVKEFVSGDDGRTRPSLSEILKTPMRVDKLIIVGFQESRVFSE
ncbi:MAG: tRNA pseudouridine(54/55) synthase Pus10 [Candidatus Altiarchaeales archaeon]|nr:MAG: tRNA pseudouridine(54/55) synthase Pus10 [Candidatus Altiarchaeales archaeon]RLI95029.1 MAG: tRNA pseudouridine(54/55) synthase Pus10 [Candidatus Altiarchaeales archaeon]HDO82277.1 tRNA pseudouridine(54/55) synthase Pus10 [Candidatus Altiarchaeales archaeon]HEX54926.1 tRNA pseudouridine(54/55) synthase Pus10 [Candidatus Altiarchaeales archaeon]